ncbi:MAG: aryl-alcohol dehydrogenase-like predicted oxidoreductase [Planctomycetaceae bacterium]|jgi:aryl-alcohol dehydrogenase-like predicted oxidoreductase
MEYRQLGNSDLQVSSIGMGCVTFGREIDREASFEVLDRALDRGITLFDSAEAYGQGASENMLGDWIADRGVRDRIVLATKVSGVLTKDRVISSAEESLQRLRIDQIDLFQVHVWDNDSPLDETLEALNSLVDSGKVRVIGCSNWRAWQLAKSLLLCQGAGLQKIQSVQPPYNLVERDIEADLLPLCADQQVGVITYSPLAAGFLTGKYGRGTSVPKGTRFDVIPGHQPLYFTEQGYAVLDRLERAAERSGHSMVQLALAWTLKQPHITTTLIGARNTAQVNQAFEAEQLQLDDELLALLSNQELLS